MAKKIVKRVVKKKRAPRKNAAPKTRNSGTMTESAFWSFIRSALRQKSRWRKPIGEAKQAARRRYRGLNKRQLWEYQCNYCKEWVADKDCQVDHIIECGSLTCSADVPGFIERLFCEKEHLQIMCLSCHNEKTQAARKKI